MNHGTSIYLYVLLLSIQEKLYSNYVYTGNKDIFDFIIHYLKQSQFSCHKSQSTYNEVPLLDQLPPNLLLTGKKISPTTLVRYFTKRPYPWVILLIVV